MYPKDKEQLDKFISGIIQSLHSEETQPKIMAQLTAEQVPVPARIGNIVSQVLTAMLVRVQKQTGEQPAPELILKSIKMIIQELSKMANLAGVEVTPEDQVQAAQIAGDMLEKGENAAMSGGQQEEQMQPQQQGIIGGMQDGR